MGLLEELEHAVRSVTDSVGPSVVGIGDRWGAGSGIVIAPGRVLTNAHNIRRDEVAVTFADGRTASATRLGVDIEGDVAVLEVDTGEAPAANWPESAPEVGVGSPVFALSNPGGKGLRVTFGLVSGTQRSFRGPRGRRIAGSIEHTAALLPGSSGGPVVDGQGRLLGINTNRLGEGFYLAIPADAALRQRVDALSRGESPARPRLGVGIAPAQIARRMRRAVGLPEIDGLLVRQVEEDSPAAAAGVQVGDLIVGAGDRAIATVDQLYEAVEALASGGTVSLRVVRGTDERTVAVTAPAKEG